MGRRTLRRGAGDLSAGLCGQWPRGSGTVRYTHWQLERREARPWERLMAFKE